ncbi:hypothetical protein L195_g047482 [Trifolium pratense]|uniref:Uncharacterized protein n=2 Tax=Trifolium pratense TaxID=57577 RepID=A0ACB0IRZ5_TRIPR|nr:hypothetical protein L195_g047482 [Trifolium pratense]CAJ2635029.1 unnamed protein product [Trifolium pratense]
MGKISGSLVLILLVVAMFLDGYGAEGVGTGNPPKKEDDVYNSRKFVECIDCMIFGDVCRGNPFLWPLYKMFCPSDDAKFCPGPPGSSEALHHAGHLP